MSQSNRSGFETPFTACSKRPAIGSQSNRSGFETIADWDEVEGVVCLNPTVVVLKPKYNGWFRGGT